MQKGKSFVLKYLFFRLYCAKSKTACSFTRKRWLFDAGFVQNRTILRPCPLLMGRKCTSTGSRGALCWAAAVPACPPSGPLPPAVAPSRGRHPCRRPGGGLLRRSANRRAGGGRRGAGCSQWGLEKLRARGGNGHSWSGA